MLGSEIPAFEGITARGTVSQALDDFTLKNTSAAVREVLAVRADAFAGQMLGYGINACTYLGKANAAL